MIESFPEPPILESGRSGLQWLLYGHVTVPFWLISLLVGLCITAALVYLTRREL